MFYQRKPGSLVIRDLPLHVQTQALLSCKQQTSCRDNTHKFVILGKLWMDCGIRMEGVQHNKLPIQCKHLLQVPWQDILVVNPHAYGMQMFLALPPTVCSGFKKKKKRIICSSYQEKRDAW